MRCSCVEDVSAGIESLKHDPAPLRVGTYFAFSTLRPLVEPLTRQRGELPEDCQEEFLGRNLLSSFLKLA